MRFILRSDSMLVFVGLTILTVMPFIGIINLNDILNGSASESMSYVFWNFRVPRVCSGMMIGAILALSGVVFQALFANPLASPFTLGVSSGAACGAAVSIIYGFSISYFGFSMQIFGALAGAFATVLLVYLVGQKCLGISGVGMLLVGVIINFFFGSLVVFLQYLADLTQLFSLMRWLMGSLEVVGYNGVIPLAVSLCLIFPYVVSKHYELDLISLGEEMASARGVAVVRVRQRLFLATSILIALSITLAGPIGFVGIIVPHAVRIIYGCTHFGLLLRSAWIGGIALILCDAIGRVIIMPAEVPVGIVTSLIGAPIFVAILVSNRGSQLFR